METVTLSEARVYVGTYNKYNSGSLFRQVVRPFRLFGQGRIYGSVPGTAQGRPRPEFMFQDYENIPEALISESWLSDKFFELRDAIEKLSETQQEAFFVWCDHHNNDISEEDADDLISSFEDEYQGEYKDEEDYAYEIVEECYDLPEFAKTYFDYSAFARDLFMTDYWMDNGFVFRCA